MSVWTYIPFWQKFLGWIRHWQVEANSTTGASKIDLAGERRNTDAKGKPGSNAKADAERNERS
jgi:hypothetical protein